MKINFFNVNQFCETLPEVTTNKIYAKRGFHPNGLFSEKMFGPVRTCTCGCGIYWGRSKIGERCSTCGVEIGYSSLRRKKFAKIELPFAVMNPIMFYLILKAGKVTVGNIVHDIIFDDSVLGYYFDPESKKYIKVKKPTIEAAATEIPEGRVLYSGSTGIFELVKFESDRNKDTNLAWKFVLENVDKFFMSSIIVCPPEFRPVSKTKDVQMRDKMNEFYMTILNFSLMLKNDVTTYENSEIQMINFRNLQRYVFNFYEYIFSKFSKKTGLIRGSILGKRIDFSARAVISPDPELNLDECSLPYVISLELFKLHIVNRLLEMKNFNNHSFVRYDPTIEYVNDCIKIKNPELLSIVEEVTKDKLVMLNRQPTLHRMGFMSFKIKINMDSVIKIHPLVCEPYNADFDGDQMAAYISLYPETEIENKEKIYILANLISPSTGKMILGVNQDILLGIYLLTKPDDTKKVTHKGIETYEGRVKFNSILPEGFPFYNRTINKKELHVLLNVIVKLYSPEIVKNMLDSIKRLGFIETTLRGVTFSLKNLGNENVYSEVSRVVDNPELDLYDKYEALHNLPIKKQLQETFPYADFIESGSRGSWDQANQLIFCRGYMSNSKGQIVETPIKNNLVHGLTKSEFFISCYGSRKALLDVALNTAVSGYLTRKLVYCNVNLELNEQLDDCGTTDYFTIRIPELINDEKLNKLIAHIPNEKERKLQIDIIKSKNDEMDPVKLVRSLIGRWRIVDKEDGSTELSLINESNCSELYGKTIKLRSPIFCKSTKVCKKCYGETYKYCHSKYVGILAAQALGEVATQLTLRTFHIGGIAKVGKRISNVSSTEIQVNPTNTESLTPVVDPEVITPAADPGHQDIISDLTIVNKYLHGAMKSSYSDLVLKLFSIYSRHKVLLLVHFELVVSQLMRIGNIRWRLHPNRQAEDYQLVSVENVPARESFLLALAFSKPYNYIVSGILGSSQTTDGILERMLINKI
jgi:DNA-directed RNA polymerase subunit beta'